MHWLAVSDCGDAASAAPFEESSSRAPKRSRKGRTQRREWIPNLLQCSNAAYMAIKRETFWSWNFSSGEKAASLKEMLVEHPMIHGGVIRRLWPDDLSAFRDHLLRLDAESRFDRFSMAVNDDFLIRYAERSFGIDEVTYGYYVDGTLRGTGELRAVGGNIIGGSVEAAFGVEMAWRRRGFGSELMDRIVRAARNRRAESLYMSCHANNAAMQGLARKFAGDRRFEADDVTGRLAARSSSAASVWGDIAENSTSFAIAKLDLQTRVYSMQRRV